MRFTIIVLLCLTAVACANHIYSLGNREPGEKLMEQKQVEKPYKLARIVDETATITIDRNYQITRVEIIDIKGEDTRAEPTVKAGGPGQNFISIDFKSQRNHGIHYMINVYGKRVLSHNTYG